MTGSGKITRRLPNWIESFIRYSNVLASPEIFRRWAAIGIVSSVLERKVWARTKGSNLYPNLYVILVGRPGVGKSVVLSPSERLLRTVGDIFVAPSSLTTASMIDTLALSSRKIINSHGFAAFNSLQVIASELGVFLPAYDPAFMNTLTKLYDGELYEERRRTGKVNHIRIEHPQLSILGGTTPSYLNSFLPEGAWDQGFTSRTIFIFSDEIVQRDIFEEHEEQTYNEGLLGDLSHDLKAIASLYGKVTWSKEAMAAISAWDKVYLEPIPEHGKLVHYNSRRLAHIIKLCVVASVSRSSEMEITIEDFQEAQNWLLEAEVVMPDIFKSMGVSGDARAMEDTWYFVYQLYGKSKRPVMEHLIISFLKDRVPSYSLNKIIEVMVRSKILKLELINGVPAYVPAPKRQ